MLIYSMPRSLTLALQPFVPMECTPNGPSPLYIPFHCPIKLPRSSSTDSTHGLRTKFPHPGSLQPRTKLQMTSFSPQILSPPLCHFQQTQRTVFYFGVGDLILITNHCLHMCVSTVLKTQTPSI